MNIRFAKDGDIPVLLKYDKHILKDELKNSVLKNRILIAEENGEFAGWLRYNLFWDSIPFMNMLYVLDISRGKGFGKELVLHWERLMSAAGHNVVMTSTVSSEFAQHFYNKLGYMTIGGFMLKNDPYEIIMSKEL